MHTKVIVKLHTKDMQSAELLSLEYFEVYAGLNSKIMQ